MPGVEAECLDVTEGILAIFGSEPQPILPYSKGCMFSETYPAGLFKIGRKGYLRYGKHWYEHTVGYNEKDLPTKWSIKARKATKIPPIVIGQHIEFFNGHVNQFMIDPCPITRKATKRYLKRYCGKCL